MTDFSTDMNVQSIKIIPKVLVDVISDSLIYVGVSISNADVNKDVWQIKKISSDANGYSVKFPNGDQTNSFIWASRVGYTYG